LNAVGALRDIVLVAAALVAVGCPRSQPATDARTLRVVEDGAPSSLDPRRSTDAWAVRVFDGVLRHVTGVGPDGRPTPDLAAAWHWPDATTLRLELDPTAQFHDGTPITATVVAAGLRALADERFGGVHAGALATVRGLRVQTPVQLDLVLSQPDPGLPGRLHLPILHPADATAPRIDAPRGSGPFRLGTRPDPDTLRLEAAQPVSADAPLVVLVRAMPDAPARGMALEAGEADLALNAVALEDLATLVELPHLAVDRFPGWNVSYVAMRTDRPPFDDLRVRQAVADLLPRAAALRHLVHGAGRLHDSLLPPALWAARVAPPREPDPARAAQLLDAAGWTDPDGPGPRPRLAVTWTTSTNPERLRLVQAMAAALGEAGIAVTVRTLEFGTLMQRLADGDVQLWSLTWVGVRDPDLLRHALHSGALPPGGANRGRHADPLLDALLEGAGRAAADPLAWQAVQARIAATLPVIPLWAHDAVVVRNRRVQGYTPRPDGGYGALAAVRLTP
jgi:peptide/nickel transport system substrate-binding protein